MTPNSEPGQKTRLESKETRRDDEWSTIVIRWQTFVATRPDEGLHAFIEQNGTVAPTHQLALARLDQQYRLDRGQQVTTEDYLALFAAVRDDSEATLVLLLAEMMAQDCRGRSVNLADFCQRFPELAEKLTQVWQFQKAFGVSGTSPKTSPNVAGGPTRVVTKSELAQAPPVEMSCETYHGSPFVDRSLPTIPGYEIEYQLGRGGMGTVYRAIQLSVNRPVALKVIRTTEDPSYEPRLRFMREAEVLATLDHPGIVRVFDLGCAADQLYFALELQEGESLDREMARGPIEARQAALYLRELAEAVHYAHQRGIIHRDLKPANILRSTTGRLKIADFGLAKCHQYDWTNSGQILGTPHYMAPEQAAGKSSEVGPATDVYGLGVILYEMLSGRTPIIGPKVSDVIDQVRRGQLTPLVELNPALPAELVAITARCLAHRPQDRFRSAGELVHRLNDYLENAAAVSTISTTPAHPHVDDAVHPSSPRAMGLTLLAFAVCIVAVAGWMVSRQQVAELSRVLEQKRLTAIDAFLSRFDATQRANGWAAARRWASTEPMIQDDQQHPNPVALSVPIARRALLAGDYAWADIWIDRLSTKIAADDPLLTSLRQWRDLEAHYHREHEWPSASAYAMVSRAKLDRIDCHFLDSQQVETVPDAWAFFRSHTARHGRLSAQASALSLLTDSTHDGLLSQIPLTWIPATMRWAAALMVPLPAGLKPTLGHVLTEAASNPVPMTFDRALAAETLYRRWPDAMLAARIARWKIMVNEREEAIAWIDRVLDGWSLFVSTPQRLQAGFVLLTDYYDLVSERQKSPARQRLCAVIRRILALPELTADELLFAVSAAKTCGDPALTKWAEGRWLDQHKVLPNE